MAFENFGRKEFYTMDDLLQIVRMLRDKENGCDWDNVQTHKSIRKNFIEETYEAVDAIDRNDKELMQEEFGDVLLQVLLHSQMEKEDGFFTFDDVVNALAQKLVLRHPHVFKNEKISGAEQVLNRWEEIKNASHGHTTISQTLDAVPTAFPALMYAQKVQKRVRAGGVHVPNQKEEIKKIRDILDNLENSDVPRNESDVADLLFSAVNLARVNGMDAEEILSLKSYNFVKIFKNFEEIALQKAIRFDTIEYAVFEKLWTQAEETCKLSK